MLVALILILWVSAIASSFIDNIPFTTATIPIIWELANSQDLCLSIRPLVWALALGACLGGEEVWSGVCQDDVMALLCRERDTDRCVSKRSVCRNSRTKWLSYFIR